LDGLRTWVTWIQTWTHSNKAVIADSPSLAGHQVYACGAPVMIDAARKDFLAQCALPEEEFYSDAFTFSAPGK